MTYCLGIKLHAGLVMLSDSRTNAGIDHISTFRKMTVFEKPGDRVLVLLSSGNLAISQAVRQHLSSNNDAQALWQAKSLYEVAQVVGDAVRDVAAREKHKLDAAGVDFNISLILGGQIAGEAPRLFNIYAAGNFIEATEDNCYFQIGEAKYGKPIIDRVINVDSSLDEAAKCALISMDSTLKSNLSVGMPLDLLVYHSDSLAANQLARIDEKNSYFQMIRNSWGQRLKQIFTELEAPVWFPSEAPASLQPLRDLQADANESLPALQQLTLGAQAGKQHEA